MTVHSVIIPAYNEGRAIHPIPDRLLTVELINNVVNEVIIINDCSNHDMGADYLY